MSFDKLQFPKFKTGFSGSMPSMKEALTQAGKHPYLGVTQGGSSRTNSGAKPAATNGLQRPTKTRSS